MYVLPSSCSDGRSADAGNNRSTHFMNVVIDVKRSRDTSVDIAGISFIILFAVSLFTPLSTLSLIFTPAPLAFLFYRGLARRAFAVLIATVIAFSWTGALPALSLLLGLIGVYAFTLGAGFRKDKLDRTAVAATLVVVVALILGIAVLQSSGQPLAALIHKSLLTAFHTSGQLRIVANGSTTQIIDQVMQEVTTYLPGLIVIVSVVITLANLAVLGAVLQRTQGPRPHVMRNIRFPKYIGGLYVLILVAQMFSSGGSATFTQFVSSAWIIISFLLVIQALSLIWWKLSHYAFGPFLAALAAVCSLVPVAGYIYVLVGLLDTIFDFRGRAGTRAP